MPHKYIELSLDDSIATLILNRPPLNIMNIEMMEEMNAALLDLRQNDELKVLLIRGRGKAFSSGIDIADHTREKVARMLQVFHRVFETTRLLDLIVVAAVDGIAFGGGFQLALGCNLIVASKSARFRLPEITVGTFPPLACVVLPRAGPRRKAMEWILTGEEIPLDDLERFGLLNRVFPDDQFDAGLQEFLGRLVSKSGPVLQLARRAQVEAYYTAYEEALHRVEDLYLRELMPLDDVKEGVESFLEKRKPKWKDG